MNQLMINQLLTAEYSSVMSRHRSQVTVTLNIDVGNAIVKERGWRHHAGRTRHAMLR